MKTLFFLLIPTLFFAQSKKEAKKLYYQSETRKIINFKKSDFNEVYKTAKCISNAYKIPLKSMPLFQKEKNEMITEPMYNHEQIYYGLGDTRLPKYNDKGELNKTCGAFTVSN